MLVTLTLCAHARRTLAAEVERDALKADKNRLRVALQRIADGVSLNGDFDADWASRDARNALGETP